MQMWLNLMQMIAADTKMSVKVINRLKFDFY